MKLKKLSAKTNNPEKKLEDQLVWGRLTKFMICNGYYKGLYKSQNFQEVLCLSFTSGLHRVEQSGIRDKSSFVPI